MTIAKCQGQNIKLTLADVSAPKTGARTMVNHLYVALSRSPGLDSLGFCEPPSKHGDTANITDRRVSANGRRAVDFSGARHKTSVREWSFVRHYPVRL